ncbi:MAG: hypothetical protein AAGB26_00075 [Planctomycetota bacterium]
MPVLLFVLISFLLIGCHKPDTFTTGDGFVSPLTEADITYAELAQQYNAAIEPLTQLWSRTDIEIEWIEVDEDGKRTSRSESGNGKFIMRSHFYGPTRSSPTETAMTVEKLGKIYLWAGSNRDHYYLFDRVDSDNKTLYIGGYAEAVLQDQPKPFPLPIHPNTVPVLLGLEPLVKSQVPWEVEPTIDGYRDQYLLSMPDRGLRMLIDPKTFRPTRVDLTDSNGFSVLTAKLSGRLEVEADQALASPPLICDKAELYVAGYESRFTLDFQSATTSGRKIKDQMFDLDALKKALKPDRLVDLDQP